MNKIQKNVHMILVNSPACRNSDKDLLYQYWVLFDNCNQLSDLLEATSAESITRARRKVQELNPSLQAKDEVRHERLHKEVEHRQEGMDLDTSYIPQ